MPTQIAHRRPLESAQPLPNDIVDRPFFPVNVSVSDADAGLNGQLWRDGAQKSVITACCCEWPVCCTWRFCGSREARQWCAGGHSTADRMTAPMRV
ncbi:Hypothetical predicted protein [Cloeon dipterum]|uniref:Uncharacterized protein n=1 Tax=Cloeon dipterum TaxID=197152 RepID=A0A8S1DZ43_9INSE|nr:Hypothetical predicted protein [Cloeon dipterum]